VGEHDYPDYGYIPYSLLAEDEIPYPPSIRITEETTVSDLLPVESIALSVGLAQVLRGEAPSDNVASMCVRALARLDGRHDWTLDEGAIGDNDG